MRVLYWTTILAVLTGAASCTSQGKKGEAFYLGIWDIRRAKKPPTIPHPNNPMTIEFRQDGRAVVVSGAEDRIFLGSYRIDLRQRPPHLDMEFRNRAGETVKTLIEQTEGDTMRMQRTMPSTPRPAGFDSDVMVLRRVESHALQRGAESAEKRDKALEHALTMDIIMFGGEQEEELLAICEAVFRYLFEHNASAAQQKAAGYFLSIDHRDPPAEFMSRFGGHSPSVKPGSQFQEGNKLKFRIDTLVWLDEATVEVEGGYYEGNASASGNTYVLRRQKGIWRVIKKKPGWIS